MKLLPLRLALVPFALLAQATLTFPGDFRGAELDLARWVAHAPGAPVSGHGVPVISNGMLHLSPGQTATTFGLFSQLYGRFEIRFRTPATGLRPRFRLEPVALASLPAIEVFSIPGDPRRISFGNSWGTAQTERAFGDTFELAAAPVHIVAIQWSEQTIVWSVDGKERFRSTDGVPRQPMFLSLEVDLAVDEATKNSTFDVESVHVYR